MTPELTGLIEPRAGEELAVLVADADEARRNVAATALRARGHRVEGVGTGREVFERLAARAIDGLLLAHELPDRSPLDVLREVVARHPRLPVIFLVPPGIEDLEIQALRAGAAQTIVTTPRYDEFIAGTLEHEVRLQRSVTQLERAGAQAASLRKQAQAQLAEGERRFALAVSQAPLMVWTTDSHLAFTWGTGAILPQEEHEPARFRGRLVEDLFPGEGDTSPAAMHRIAVRGRACQFEWHWRDRWLDFHLEPMRGEDGAIHGVVGMALDVTERRRAEEALRLSEERFILLGRATNDMAWDWDLETDSIWRNENLTTIFGYTAEDMEPAGAWWELHIHPEDRDRVLRGIHEAIARGERYWSAEYRWQRKDGSYATILDRGYVLLDEQGKPIRMVGSTMDITKRRQEERIREAIYRISEAAVASKDLAELYAEVHRIVAGLMPAQNFYIALHDPATDLLSFPYFVDQEETTPAPYKAGRGLTEYVLRSGRPFYASTEGYEKLVALGEVVRIGPMSIDWVGVPLIAHGRTIGVLVLQTYTEGVRYGETERDVLSYVSEQIAMAIERKRTEEALRESEERYRMLFESNPTPMWVYDLENLRFLAVNDIAVEHYGYSREEFLAMSIRDIRAPEEVRALVASVHAPRKEIEHSGTWKHRTKDGRTLLVEITSHTLTFAGRSAVLVLAEDVTLRQKAVQEREAAESMFRSLVEHTLIGIYIIQDGRFKYVNPRFAEILGYTQEEILALPRGSHVIAPEDRPRAEDNIRRRLEGEPPVAPYTIGAVRKDGSRITIEVRGNQVEFEGRPAVLGSLRDVTEAKQAEEALRRSEARFRTLFESAADVILLVSGKGVILDANPATETLVHLGRPQIVGAILEDFLPPEDLPRARAYLREVFDGGSPREPFESVLLLPNGVRRALEVRSRLVSEAGSQPYAEMTVRDVTEQQEMNRRLLAAERLASVGQMAAYIAHEINTPLANISLLTAASKRRTKDEEVRERLEKIDTQRRQAASIIADLLNFTKHREIQPMEIDLRSILTAAADQMDPYRAKDVDLVLELGEGPSMSRVDPLQIQEVFVNLLRNALEATPQGSVTVRLEARPGYRVVTITDTGHGIPPDVQARLFQPFVTTKRQKGGTGLGLALCRNIVSAHGGEIHFSSTPGKGTTFVVVLPQEEVT